MDTVTVHGSPKKKKSSSATRSGETGLAGMYRCKFPGVGVFFEEKNEGEEGDDEAEMEPRVNENPAEAWVRVNGRFLMGTMVSILAPR